MNPQVRARMQKRIDEMHARLAVLRWECRQRHRAKGVWHRLRRVLARADRIYAASAEVAEELRAAGCVPESVGLELHPAKHLFWVSPERTHRPDVRRIEPRLDAELLAAPVLLLVPFE